MSQPIWNSSIKKEMAARIRNYRFRARYFKEKGYLEAAHVYTDMAWSCVLTLMTLYCYNQETKIEVFS